MKDTGEYSPQEDIQGMIDRAVDRDGAAYVHDNIGQLLAGVNVVMNVDKEALEVPTALDAALDRWNPSTGLDPAVTRAQTRRTAEHLATTGDALGRAALLDALADGTTLPRSDLWGRAVDPGLRQLVDADLVKYHALNHTCRWIGEGEP